MEVDRAAGKRWLHRDAKDGHTSGRLASYDASAQTRSDDSQCRRPGMAGTEERRCAAPWSGESFVCSCALDRCIPGSSLPVVWAEPTREIVMKMKRHEFTVQDLLDFYDNQMLKANPEYQRGIVWSVAQKKKLIDSLMRGYPLPLIYLHHIKRTVAGAQRDDFEIIDGQQRINSLHEFREGAHKLFDPLKDDQEGKFPNFLKAQPCPWA